ncbi:MAG: GNAT family N-acetyltransferase [Candidatus Methanoperedens sp.]|nr:GNAT family N-acetyltransferase [Candidatus Methanoperedens sp.]
MTVNKFFALKIYNAVINTATRIYLMANMKTMFINPRKYPVPHGTIIIRQMNTKDLTDVIDIFYNSFNHLSAEEQNQYAEEMKKYVYKYPAINSVAEFEGKIVGFITSVPRLHLSKKGIEIHLNITWMAIDSNYRGLKISNEMLDYLLYVGSAMRNIKKIMTQTNVTNIPAIKAYEKLGFSHTKILPEFINKEDGIKLEKII